MKALSFLALLVSCSTYEVNDYPHAIPQIQKCWELKSVECIKNNFGKPQVTTQNSISYVRGKNEFLTIFHEENGQNLVGAQLWLFDPTYSTASAIKHLLPSEDWKTEKIEETNPHVVNLAETNFSNRLKVSFLTYKLDKNKKVRVIYWGGDYKKLEL